MSHQDAYPALRDEDRERARKLMDEEILFVRDALLRSMDCEAESVEVASKDAVLEIQVVRGDGPGVQVVLWWVVGLRTKR